MNIYNLRSHSLEKTISRFQSRIEFLTQKSNKFSVYRLSIFIAGLVLTIGAFIINKELGWVTSAISILSFGIAVHFHNKLLMGIKRCHSYLKIKEAGMILGRSGCSLNYYSNELAVIRDPKKRIFIQIL